MFLNGIVGLIVVKSLAFKVKLQAGNYLQVKQEAIANQPYIPQFGPSQLKTSTNPINCQQLQTNVITTESIKLSTDTKPTTTKHDLKAFSR